MSDTPKTSLDPVESRAAISLAAIFGLRMLGLFLILPVFALYAEDLHGVTPFLVGVAIGAYGLTQAILQIPFGMISDRLGRKPVIVVGLLIFALGSVVAAMAQSIEGVIIGRALQGSGAVAAAIMALAADLTREQNRTRIMAVIGMSIGFAFTLSLVLGPILDGWIGVPGIFWLTALLALLGVVIVIFLVPSPRESRFHRDAECEPGRLGAALRNMELVRLDLGILVLHMVLTAMFVVLPLALRDFAEVAPARHWLVYLPVMLLAMGFMVPFIVIAEKRRKMKGVMITAVALLGLALGGFYLWHHTLIGILISLLIFFTAFNIAEASLPSLVSKIAPTAGKGSAMGVYSTSQFLGAFIGGALGGWIHQHHGVGEVFLFCLIAVSFWFLIVIGMRPPRHLRNHIATLGAMTASQAAELKGILLARPGIDEVEVVAEDGLVYLKIDADVTSEREIDEFLRQGL
jgi:MFS family permease